MTTNTTNTRPVNIDGINALVGALERRRIRVEAADGNYRLFDTDRAAALIRYFSGEQAANAVTWRAWLQLGPEARDGFVTIDREGGLRVQIDHGGE